MYSHIYIYFQARNPETDDYYDYKGILEYAWSMQLYQINNTTKQNKFVILNNFDGLMSAFMPWTNSSMIIQKLTYSTFMPLHVV